MTNGKRNALILALILCLVGAAISTFALARVGFDFGKLGSVKMREYEVTPEEPFTYISAVTNRYDFSLQQSADGKARVKIICPEDETVSVSAEDDVLKLRTESGEHWLKSILNFKEQPSSVTVYLPPEQAAALTVTTTSGDFESLVINPFVNVSVQTTSGDIAWNGDSKGQQFDFTTTSGDVSVNRIEALRLNVQTTSGDIDLRECGCGPQGGITVGTTSGEILLKSSSAQAVAAHSTSGDITLESVECADAALLNTTSGEIRLADLVTAGICQIDTTSGDVHLVRADAGKFEIGTVSGDVTGSLAGIENEVRTDGSAAEENWTVNTTSGFVHIFPVSAE